MFKKYFLIGLIIVLFAVGFATPGYCDGPLKKLGRGICNFATFPFEMFLQPSRVNNTDGPAAALSWGILKGVGMSFERLGVGLYEILTFPIPVPKDYAPIMTDPEFFFEEQNW